MAVVAQVRDVAHGPLVMCCDEIIIPMCIFSIISVGTKIHEFLSMHPEVLKDYSKKERTSKIRTKIINMRRQNREDLELRLKKLTK